MIFPCADIQNLSQYSPMLCDESLINNFGAVSTSKKDALFPLKISDSSNKMVLLPAPEFSALLYRGENQFNNPCKPTLLRNMSDSKKLTEVLKKYQFIEVLKTHPLSIILKEKEFLGNYKEVPNYRLNIDFEAIAQHYEFKTNHLDLTRDRDVAMFFLTCKYENGRYRPITDYTEGVLYTYDFKLGMLKNEHRINPIGFQPFSRPDKQKAFSIIFNTNTNFNDFEFVKYEKIQITPKLSYKYYEMFNEGKSLFPKDEVSELSQEINNSKYVSKDILEKYSFVKNIPKKKIINALKKEGYVLTENKYSFKISDHNAFQANLSIMINELESRIHIRKVSEHYQA